MKKRTVWVTAIFVLASAFLLHCEGGDARLAEVPTKGMVTMLDLGAKQCIPCKMMAPILQKMEKAYKGKAAIIFIDVSKQSYQAMRFGIRAIPTQIFFDKDGKEVYRHLGFMSEEAIVWQLKRMGVDQGKNGKPEKTVTPHGSD
ncbi:MAG: thioredoxin family protein [Desulfobacterales bacterium]|nr:MAG: thioredoxin family protein [Desulfobacterales bacterium]